jgi:hypothetical protein
MAENSEDRPIGEAMELLKTDGFCGLANATTASNCRDSAAR